MNNAGVARGKTILDSTQKDIELTFNVNTLSHYWLAQEFLPNMIKNDHGMIITVASLAGYITPPNLVDFAASKAAAVAFHEGLGAELLTRYNAPKVRTVLVTQGHTDTSLFKGFKSEQDFLAPMLRPETVAEAILTKAFTGTSGHVILPGMGNLITSVRALPNWAQATLRAKSQDLMLGFKGRQVSTMKKLAILIDL